MPPVGFETIISAGERPQTYALDRAATGTGPLMFGSALTVNKDTEQVYMNGTYANNLY